MKTAWGYARASTIEQADTLHNQTEATEREWDYRWKGKGYVWGGCTVDSGVSGNVPLRQRPNGARLCATMQPGDVVIFTKLDRGFRNVRDLLATLEWFRLREIDMVLLDHGTDTTTAAGRMFLTVLGAFAEFERARMSERMLETWARRRKLGKPCSGKAPYGFKIAGPKGSRYFTRDEYTRGWGAKIVEWINRDWTADDVYFHLLQNRVKTRKGKEWSRGAIQRAYVGEMRLQRAEAKVAKKTGLTPDGQVSSLTPGQSAANGANDENETGG